MQAMRGTVARARNHLHAGAVAEVAGNHYEAAESDKELGAKLVLYLLSA